ncbi:MAG: SPOR domain-containing protein [Salinibacter sp.]
MRLRYVFALPLFGLLALTACSGPSQTSSEGPDPARDDAAGRDDEARAAVSTYETFDVSAYPVRPPQRTVEVTHEVPRRLMQGRADEGVKQTVEGYRIQVYSAQDQEASQEFREKVRQWWMSVQDKVPSDLFQGQPPIVIEYSQPYYRVRIGAFADREEATEALKFVRKQFSGAFVARSTVTIVR